MDELDAENSGGTTLSISGMTCNGCANTVTRVLSRGPGVESANVDFENGRAVVYGHSAPRSSDQCRRSHRLRRAHHAGEINRRTQ